MKIGRGQEFVAIAFRPLGMSDLDLTHRWLNEESLGTGGAIGRAASQVVAKYSTYITWRARFETLFHHRGDGKPNGYLQTSHQPLA